MEVKTSYSPIVNCLSNFIKSHFIKSHPKNSLFGFLFSYWSILVFIKTFDTSSLLSTPLSQLQLVPLKVLKTSCWPSMRPSVLSNCNKQLYLEGLNLFLKYCTSVCNNIFLCGLNYFGPWMKLEGKFIWNLCTYL